MLLSTFSRRFFLTLALLFIFLFNVLSKSPENETKKIEKNVETYIKGIKYISAEFVQLSSLGDVYEGKFWLSKEKGQEVKIIYTEGVDQEISIKDEVISIIDNDNNKAYSYPISQTPIYAILNNGLDLSKEKYTIVENSHKCLRLKLNKGSLIGGVDLTLIFSKYSKTKNIKNLEGWIIDDGKVETLFSFYPEKLFVNDKKKVPHSIFKKHNSNKINKKFTKN